jgi:MEMO1 family protein
MADYPRLRGVNAFPVRNGDETLLCLQDPENVSEKVLFLPPAAVFVVSRFDGRHSVVDIQSDYMRHFGEFLFTEQVEALIAQLDEGLFLENERLAEARRLKDDAFRKAPRREASCAGKSYEEDPALLRSEIDGYFTGPEGPGPAGRAHGVPGLKGVVAPHIDFRRGGFCYAHTHRRVAEAASPGVFVILGTAHVATRHPFVLTRKDFETPLGRLDVDQGLVDRIASRCSDDLFQDERFHQAEHSIEFQCVFLRYLYPVPAALKIVPVLCGSLHGPMADGISPMDWSPVQEFVEALREASAGSEGGVCLVASADLAHMGPQFGDEQEMGERELKALEEADREMLSHVEAGDGEGFYRSILLEQDRRKICGLPAVYTLLQALGGRKGELLKYGQSLTPETRSAVSFASLVFP